MPPNAPPYGSGASPLWAWNNFLSIVGLSMLGPIGHVFLKSPVRRRIRLRMSDGRSRKVAEVVVIFRVWLRMSKLVGGILDDENESGDF